MASSSDAKLKFPDPDIADENADILDDIIALLECSHRRHAEVILLIGISGSGKSSLVNTIHKVLTGQYYQIARHGCGKAASVTLDLTRYNNCGISLETIRNEDRRQQIERIWTKLPHIVDCAGLDGENTPELREILELIVGGFIPPGTQVKALIATQLEFGVGSLRAIYSKSNPAWKATRVVFMHSCRAVYIPTELINCLTEVLQIVDPVTLRRKCSAEVFLLITKYDLVHDAEVSISETTNQECVTLEDFVKVEEAIAPHLNIVGTLDEHRIRWASFTKRHKSDNAYIENTALKFLKRMVEPGPPEQESTAPVLGSTKKFKLLMNKKLTNAQIKFKRHLHQGRQMNISRADVLLAVLMCLVLVAGLYYAYTVVSEPL